MNERSQSDVAAFERLYVDTRAALLGYLLRRTDNPEDASELLGEVYLTAWRRFEDLPAGDEARLWLYGVARGVLANHRRGLIRAQGRAERLRAELATGGRASPAADNGDRETVTAVRTALHALSADDRELITLAAWEGLSAAEIGRVLGLSANAARVRLHRARGRLRRELLQRTADIDDRAAVSPYTRDHAIRRA